MSVACYYYLGCPFVFLHFIVNMYTVSVFLEKGTLGEREKDVRDSSTERFMPKPASQDVKQLCKKWR